MRMIRGALAVLACSAALAACAAETGETDAPDATASAGGSTVQADGAAAPAQAAEGSDQAAAGPELDLSNCSRPPERRVHVRVANSVLALPAENLARLIPSSAGQGGSLEVAPGLGCPEQPLDAALVLMGQVQADPILDGGIGLRAPEASDQRFSEVTARLQREQPEGGCREAAPELLGCFGNETRQGRTQPVLYLVTTRGDARLASGGPLAARCLLDAEGTTVLGCGVSDIAKNGVVFEAALAQGSVVTVDALIQARDAAATYVEGLGAS